MTLDEISELYMSYWKPGYGAVTPDELVFVQSLIQRHRPERFVEIGMASGLSTGFIARFLEDTGGKYLLSVDHDDTFFGDTTKPNGFLIPELYSGSEVDMDLRKFTTALDSASFEGTFDMAFVDANHQHPWPMIDMMALYPLMSGPKMMVHHDLRLYQNQDVMFGIGPKYLFDQFPDAMRIRSDANDGNIFAVYLSMPKAEFEDLCYDLVKLPWSLRGPVSDSYRTKILEMLERSYSPRFVEQFERCLKSYNHDDRFRSGL